MSKFYITPDKMEECNIHKKSRKVRRLIILHPITIDGPLVEKDHNGNHVDEF